MSKKGKEEMTVGVMDRDVVDDIERALYQISALAKVLEDDGMQTDSLVDGDITTQIIYLSQIIGEKAEFCLQIINENPPIDNRGGDSMKTISIKILSMKKSEKILCDLWAYITESLITEFSIVDAADEDKQKYGAKTSLITINAITGVDDDDSVKSEFSAACAFLNEEYAGAFVVKEFTVNDSLFADKLRFNALVSQKERQRINTEVTT
jgi:hypothetical protein